MCVCIHLLLPTSAVEIYRKKLYVEFLSKFSEKIVRLTGYRLAFFINEQIFLKRTQHSFKILPQILIQTNILFLAYSNLPIQCIIFFLLYGD